MNSKAKVDSLCAVLAVLALSALGLSIVAGLLASLYYGEGYRALKELGLHFNRLRPLHTSFAIAWIFLAGVSAVYAYLREQQRGVDEVFLGRLRSQLLLWGLAGVGIAVTLALGVFSGREYLGFHPGFSALILAGWLFFIANFARAQGFRLRGEPVYVYMWTVGLFLFVVAFVEGHLYLVPAIGEQPLRDIAVQWKAYGPFVGSFNMLVYGALIYLSERLRGDESYARSNLAFALFFIGTLNSFTNFVHHTYHLPQSHVVKYISFSVSMAEVLILLKVLIDITLLSRSWRHLERFPLARLFIVSATLWTGLQLVLALLMSIPPINALLHGTHIVAAHVMGSMIGIDSMILWAFFSCLSRPGGKRGRAIFFAGIGVNVFLLMQWTALLLSGAGRGVMVYTGTIPSWYPGLSEIFPAVFMLAGSGLLLSIGTLIVCWIGPLLRACGGRSLFHKPIGTPVA